jgi:hypothetical protein
MLKSFLLGAGLLALHAAPAQAQASPPPAVAILTKWSSSFNNRHILIDRDGKVETIDFTANFTLSGVTTEAETLRKAIAQLYQEGYRLKSTTSDGAAYSLIFIKGE